MQNTRFSDLLNSNICNTKIYCTKSNFLSKCNFESDADKNNHLLALCEGIVKFRHTSLVRINNGIGRGGWLSRVQKNQQQNTYYGWWIILVLPCNMFYLLYFWQPCMNTSTTPYDDYSSSKTTTVYKVYQQSGKPTNSNAGSVHTQTNMKISVRYRRTSVQITIFLKSLMNDSD